MCNVLIYCDRCGARIAEGRSLLTTTAGPLATTRPTTDLCRDCAAHFATWLQGDPFLEPDVPAMPMQLGRSA